jgi:hypothetical protein
MPDPQFGTVTHVRTRKWLCEEDFHLLMDRLMHHFGSFDGARWSEQS